MIWLDGSLLASPHATRAGPTFEAWLDSDDPKTVTYGALPDPPGRTALTGAEIRSVAGLGASSIRRS